MAFFCRFNKKSPLILGFYLLLLCSQNILANTDVATVNEVKGSAYAKQPAEERRQLTAGDSIFENDLVTTEAKSLVKLQFKDNTRFEVGPDGKLLANKFIYNQQGKEDSFSVEMLKGAFRFVSGLIAKKKPRAMEVNTAVATIGIRGTHVVGEADATSATVILMEPEDDPDRKTAIEVANRYGAVTIDEPGYGTEVPDEFSPPSPPRRMRLQTINNLTRSLQSSQRINLPRPRF